MVGRAVEGLNGANGGDDVSDQPATTRRAGHSKLHGRPLNEDGNIELRVERTEPNGEPPAQPESATTTANCELGEPPPLEGEVLRWWHAPDELWLGYATANEQEREGVCVFGQTDGGIAQETADGKARRRNV